jgi:hypothetical protein
MNCLHILLACTTMLHNIQLSYYTTLNTCRHCLLLLPPGLKGPCTAAPRAQGALHCCPQGSRGPALLPPGLKEPCAAAPRAQGALHCCPQGSRGPALLLPGLKGPCAAAPRAQGALGCCPQGSRGPALLPAHQQLGSADAAAAGSYQIPSCLQTLHDSSSS